jgi:hypothetical protein
MGFAQNIVMLMLVISILSDTVGVPAGLTTPSVMSQMITGNGSAATDYVFYVLMTDASTGIFVVVTVILGLFVFPNPYAIFAGLALAMLGTFIVMPYQMFHTLPSPINLILTYGFGMSVMFGVLNWFKGGTGEI